MASMWPPKKNTAFTLYFTLYKSDGTVIANPGTMTRAVSIDGGAVDTTPANAITEEDTTYGQISWVLSADEMNGDAIWVYAKDNTSGCVPFTATLYTAANTQDELGTSIASILDDTGTAGVVLAADAITAAKIADNAIAAEHIADDAIVAANLATGCITADAFAADAIVAATLATDAITDDAIATGAIASTAFAAGAINAAAIANGAIDNATFAADVGSTAYATNVIGLAARKALDDYDPPTKAEMDSAFSTTNGKVDAVDDLLDTEVAAITAAVITNAAGADVAADIIALKTVADTIAADTTTDIPATITALQGDVTDILTDTGTTLDTLIKDIPTNAELATALAAADDAVLSAVAALNDFDPAADTVAHVTLVDTTTTNTDMVAAAPSAASVADAVWDEVSTGHTDAGKAGAQVWTDLDAVLADTNELQTNQGNWLTATGFSTLDAAGVRTAVGMADADLDTQLAALPTDADVETAAGAALTTYDPPTKAEMDTALAGLASDTDVADAVWSAGTRTLTAIDEDATTLDIDAAVQAAAGAALTAYDPPTKAELDSAVSPLATAASVTALNDFDPASDVVAHVTLVDTTTTNTDMVTAAPAAADVADAVWDEALSGHAGAGSAGAALSAAGTAGDPWSIDIPGAYADGTAGQKLGDIMDDLEDGGRTDLLIDAIKAQTDALDGYTVTVVSPVADSGTVTLYAGDDYDDAHGRALTFSLAVSGVPDLTAATVVMKTQESSWTATSCTSDGTDWTVLFEPTAADTAALGNLRQTYEVEATLSDGDVATLATGTLVVARDVA
jgi:hypothetical protein